MWLLKYAIWDVHVTITTWIVVGFFKILKVSVPKLKKLSHSFSHRAIIFIVSDSVSHVQSLCWRKQWVAGGRWTVLSHWSTCEPPIFFNFQMRVLLYRCFPFVRTNWSDPKRIPLLIIPLQSGDSIVKFHSFLCWKIWKIVKNLNKVQYFIIIFSV